MPRRFIAAPPWSIALPVAACLLLAAVWAIPAGIVVLVVVGAVLIASVLVAVYHAETVAHRVGEPFGTLILAMAVTAIELGLIGSMMASGGLEASTLARDTVFATVMIVLNGVVGVCLLAGTLRHRILTFRIEGTGQALSVLAPMTVLTLVLPTFTVTAPGPVYTGSQLAFAGIASLLLYVVFVFVQTSRHRDDFVSEISENTVVDDDADHRPSRAAMWSSLVLLVIALVAVIGLAKKLAPSIEASVKAADAPDAVTGIIIALLVLLPETSAAVRAALRNRMQTSLNLALGSALATIGLTIPAVAVLATLLHVPLELGLSALQIVLLAISLLVATCTLARGRATVLHGAVHLILFGAYLFLAVVP
ncbi:MAG TPA: ionic transporter y4hA [Rhodanobacteraceae bacterium]